MQTVHFTTAVMVSLPVAWSQMTIKEKTYLSILKKNAFFVDVFLI
jgi:hypothetical protein